MGDLKMNKEQFVRAVAELVAGLQVPVSMPGGSKRLGAGLEPWQKLLHLQNGGFGWTNADGLEERYRELMGLRRRVPEREPPEPQVSHTHASGLHYSWLRHNGRPRHYHDAAGRTHTEGLPHCNCPKAGIWGATGEMPDGHVWQWENADHSGGHLAHLEEDGPVQAEGGSGDPQ